MELVSIPLSELNVGDSAFIEKTVTAADVDAFAACSGDSNPLHTDEAYARERGFRDRIAHGALLFAYVSNVVGTQLPGARSVLHSLQMKFMVPVCIGDTVRVTVAVDHISLGMNAITMSANLANIETGEVVAKGKIQVGFAGKETA